MVASRICIVVSLALVQADPNGMRENDPEVSLQEIAKVSADAARSEKLHALKRFAVDTATTRAEGLKLVGNLSALNAMMKTMANVSEAARAAEKKASEYKDLPTQPPADLDVQYKAAMKMVKDVQDAKAEIDAGLAGKHEVAPGKADLSSSIQQLGRVESLVKSISPVVQHAEIDVASQALKMPIKETAAALEKAGKLMQAVDGRHHA
jgi:hypothetical protein